MNIQNRILKSLLIAGPVAISFYSLNTSIAAPAKSAEPAKTGTAATQKTAPQAPVVWRRNIKALSRWKIAVTRQISITTAGKTKINPAETKVAVYQFNEYKQPTSQQERGQWQVSFWRDKAVGKPLFTKWYQEDGESFSGLLEGFTGNRNVLTSDVIPYYSVYAPGTYQKGQKTSIQVPISALQTQVYSLTCQGVVNRPGRKLLRFTFDILLDEGGKDRSNTGESGEMLVDLADGYISYVKTITKAEALDPETRTLKKGALTYVLTRTNQ